MDATTQKLDYVAFNILLDDPVFPDRYTQAEVHRQLLACACDHSVA